MKWLEIIRLRTAGNRDGLLEEFLQSLTRVEKGRELIEVKTYHHATLGTDLCVQLLWESARPEQNGTALGLRLVQGLKEFGLADHSIWIEDEK